MVCDTNSSADDDNLIPRSCDHITFIKSEFIGKILQLTHPSITNESENRCFVPECREKYGDKFKTFYPMGIPPRRTYYPINYVGLGLYISAERATSNWYTAFVPLNLLCFNNDIYHLKLCLIKLIEKSTFWKHENSEKLISDNGYSAVDEKYEKSSDVFLVPEGVGTQGILIKNMFRMPLASKLSDYTRDCIFATPSCMYATATQLASPIDFDGIGVRLQIIVEAKVRPGSYLEAESSLENLEEKFDCCFSNSEIEWYVANVGDIVPQRLLFKILRRDGDQSLNANDKLPTLRNPPAVSYNQSSDKALIRLIMPNRLTKDSITSKQEFITIRNLYMTETQFEDSVTLSTSEESRHFLVLLKLRWTENHNKVVYCLKSLISSKRLEWDSDSKVWRIPQIFLFEVVKFALHLSLKVSDKALYELWLWLCNFKMRGIGTKFSKHSFLQWMSDFQIWSFQRVNIKIVPGSDIAAGGNVQFYLDGKFNGNYGATSGESFEIDIVPFNKELVTKFKERNSNRVTYTWNSAKQCWVTNNLSVLLKDVMAVLPNIREFCTEDTKALESRGINLKDLQISNKRLLPTVYEKRGKIKRVEEYDCDHDFVTINKIMITAAGKDHHILRVIEKIKRVVETIEPPSSSISADGKIIMGGAGTGGIEFVETPRGVETWNQISLCVLPNEVNGSIPVDNYDQNLLASLIGEVYIIKEKAIDYLLNNFKRWPGPHESVNYARWSKVTAMNEPRCWGGLTFDERQKLAQSRLFCDEDFYISGPNTNNDAALCRLLIELGRGKIVKDAKDAEYVVITDKDSQEALDLHRKFGNNDEDIIANTHGARHSTLVTPKYIYDCILEWKLKRPTRCHQHLAF